MGQEGMKTGSDILFPSLLLAPFPCVLFSGLSSEEKRDIQVKILDVLEGLAMVKATSAMFWDYLQLAKIEGEWKIINVLWVMNPSALPPSKR